MVLHRDPGMDHAIGGLTEAESYAILALRVDGHPLGRAEWSGHRGGTDGSAHCGYDG
jgi:hypothetical protein